MLHKLESKRRSRLDGNFLTQELKLEYIILLENPKYAGFDYILPAQSACLQNLTLTTGVVKQFSR